MNTHKLDNPTWYALSENHRNFGMDYNGMKFYQPEYCPFGGFMNQGATRSGIEHYSMLTDSFFVVGERPLFDNKVLLKNELICNQMILDQQTTVPISETIILLETDAQKNDLLKLVNLVQPGYFRQKTSDLGDYYGIYKDNKLIAVTGERMKMDSHTEVSAVVTHPDHTGKGYAKQLVTFTINKIIEEHKIPFLHVAETNIGAIKLYETLGFRTRRKISFWNFVSKVE